RLHARLHGRGGTGGAGRRRVQRAARAVILDALLPLVAGALVFATNFALVVGLTAVGASVTERAGVLNLGHEGVMLLGAAAGFIAAYSLRNPWAGLAAGVVAGLFLGLVKAV